MPATKKKKTVKKTVKKVAPVAKSPKMPESTQALLFVFAIAMMVFAYVLVQTYAK